MKTQTFLATILVALTLMVGCATQEQTGAVVGGVTGAVVGSQIGGGEGKNIAIAIGAIAGTMIGASIGRNMDEQDRHVAGLSLERNRTREPSRWRNPDTGIEYAMTPTRTFRGPDGPCREFTMDAIIGGRPQSVYGTACRQPDGSWLITR